MAEAIIGQCASCGAAFKEVKGKSNRFCSMSCYRDMQRSGAYKRGHGPDFYRAPCAYCGAEVRRHPSTCRDGRTSDKAFCNRGCYDAFRSAAMALRTRQCAGCGCDFIPDVPTRKYCSEACWKHRKKAKPKHCVNCGCWFTPMKFHATAQRLISANSGKTCSRACNLAWISNNEERKRKIGDAFRSVKHPNWQGGKSQLNNISNRGPNWQQQRAAALRRDGHKCVDCSMSDGECREKYGRGLDVDHIVPYHNFGNYRKANALGNLACRCTSCHRIAEAKRSMVQMVLPMQDSEKRRHKGSLRGEKINTAKLTAADVLVIRRRAAAGETAREIWPSYSMMAIGSLYGIISRKTWRHL